MPDQSKGAASAPALRPLPREMAQLIHHVELHKSGWWDKAIDRLVLATFWLHGPLSPEDALAHIREVIGDRIDEDRILQISEKSKASGILLDLKGKLKVAEEVGKVLESELAASRAAESDVRSRFDGVAKAEGIESDSDQVWRDFEDTFFFPLLTEQGARLYEVLDPRKGSEALPATYGQLLAPLVTKYGPAIQRTLINFLDPSSSEIRAYVLRRLNAYFIREASGLDASVLEALRQGQGQARRLRILLDTNFVFSLLALHANPANQIAQDFVTLLEKVRSSVTVEMHVLPITIDEARGVLQDVISRLEGTTLPRGIALATRRLAASGLVQRYFEEVATHGSIDAQSFFGPYESNLLAILREKGVEIFNEDIDSLRTDQQVIDDLHDQEEIQKKVRRRGAKHYEANLHDMVLWHFTNRKRPTSIDSPLDAQFWICTLDYGFVSFDRAKRKGRQSPPISLTPGSFIQMLQFWAPRSDELDRALVGAMREPLLFLDFDRADEATTIRIIKALARFEGAEDLQEGTIYRILTADALRARIAKSPYDAKRDLEFVEAAAIAEAKELEKELVALQEQRERDTYAAREAEERSSEMARTLEDQVRTRDSRLNELSSELEALKAQLEKESERHRLEREEALSKHEALEEKLQSIEARKLRYRQRLVLTFGTLLAASIGALTSIVPMRILSERVTWLRWGVAIGAGLILWLVGCEVLLSRLEITRMGKIHNRLRASRKWLLAAFVAIVLGVTTNAIWDELKPASAPKDTPQIRR